MTIDLVEKYALERNKRIRPDGLKQYMDTRTPGVQDLAKDPWVDYDALAKQPVPLRDGSHIRFVIIGAGHNGLLFAARLIEAGFKTEEIVIVDTAGGFGGTWYWNRYPGLMCDVEGYVYLPLLEETGYMPKHKYSYGAEIRGQSERIAAKWKIQAMFCTKVEEQKWDDDKRQWTLKIIRNLGPSREPENMTVTSQFILSAGGVLSIPKVPKAPGFQEFRRSHHVFHTSRWDYNYTGGSQQDPSMVNLQNKRVAIIGTGATAVQAVPELAKWAKHLYVIQRTPSYCGERNQRETDPHAWAQIAGQPGWQRERQINFNHFVTNDPVDVDLVNDGWTATLGAAGLIGSPRRVTPETVDQFIDELVQVDTPQANKVRDRIGREIRDPLTAEKLKPWYPGWCKRPTFNDDYLQSFNRPNVTLVDTDGKGIESFTELGLKAGGQELEIDVLILATGFISGGTQTPSQRLDAPIIGRNGRSIDDKWTSADFGTLFGITLHQFPNYFASFFPGGTASYNLTSGYDIGAKLIAYVIAEACRTAEDPGRLVIEASKASEDLYSREVSSRALGSAALRICTPTYFTGEGTLTQRPATAEEAQLKAKKANWGTGINEFRKMVESYMSRRENVLEGFELSCS
ncbi:hypothetical protein AB5N19_07002 [Seiridium cardinale]